MSSGTGSGSGSASVTFVTSPTGWHVLTVGYSQSRGIGIARSIKSSTFLVGGHSWCITYFPDGLTEGDAADWICVGLRLEHHAAGHRAGHDVSVRIKYSLLDQAGAPSYTRASSSTCTFSGLFWSCTLPRFIRREDLLSRHVSDDHDTFRVRCDVTVLGVRATVPLSTVPPPDAHRHLGDLLTSGVGADVTLVVGGETFPAHRAVLAERSPVFMAAFFGGPPNEIAAAGRVRVSHVEPRVFEAMLRFIYTDRLPEMGRGEAAAMAPRLLLAAGRFKVERLVSLCECILCSCVDASVAVITLVLAKVLGCQRLREACFRVLKSSGKKALLEGDDFQFMATTCPSILHWLRQIRCHDIHCFVQGTERSLSAMYSHTR